MSALAENGKLCVVLLELHAELLGFHVWAFVCGTNTYGCRMHILCQTYRISDAGGHAISCMRMEFDEIA